MSDQKLYELLRGERDTSIPFEKAAAHFLKLKVASGGVPAYHVDLLKQAEEEGWKKEVANAQHSGFLSGIRSTVSGDVAQYAKHKRTAGERAGTQAGTLGGAVLGGLAGGKGNRTLSAALGAVLGRGAGKAVGQSVDAKKIKSIYSPKTKAASTSATPYGVNAMEAPAADEYLEPPVAEGEEAAPDADAVESFLQAQQEANESEFFRQQAAEATEAAQTAEQRAQMAEDQLQQMSAEHEQMTVQTQQATEMASQQAQGAQQETAMAQEESLAAKQQAMQMRQSITAYRQQLMDILSQDPTQGVAPPQVPVAPEAGGPQMEAPPEEAGAPQEAGPQAGPPMEAPQPPPMAGPPQGGGPAAMAPPPGAPKPPAPAAAAK